MPLIVHKGILFVRFSPSHDLGFLSICLFPGFQRSRVFRDKAWEADPSRSAFRQFSVTHKLKIRTGTLPLVTRFGTTQWWIMTLGRVLVFMFILLQVCMHIVGYACFGACMGVPVYRYVFYYY